MGNQEDSWNEVAGEYETEFIDPYRADVTSPLLRTLRRLAGAGRVAADLGCGIGPLLPFLADHFSRVYAVDFADRMLKRARERCRELANVEFVRRSLTDLRPLAGKVDVAVAVNSLVMPDLNDLEKALQQVRACLRHGGVFVGIVPAMDAMHYYTMLLVDRARQRGLPLPQARKNAAAHADHSLYDFAFGQFRYRGLEQHFWQPFEIRYRFGRAGFGKVKTARVDLSWQQFACGEELMDQAPPWDWFVRAEAE